MTSTWTLDRVVLYSLDGRKAELDFQRTGVTIICSGNHTGKSALIEVVDYTLGASRWRAADRVRTATEWVATVWARGDHTIFAGRRVPKGSKRESADCSFLVLGNSALPAAASDIAANCNTAGLKESLERQFGIGFVKGESFGRRFDETKVTVRHATPYLFQSDDVIVNKTQLLRGFSGDKRSGNLAAVPYYLGVIDERATTDAHRLALLKRQRKALDRRIASLEGAESTRAPTTQKLLAEGVELGLLDGDVLQMDADDSHLALSELQVHVMPSQVLESTNPQLANLRDEEASHLERLGTTTALRRDAAELLKASGIYSDAVLGQQQRLEAVNLFGDVGEESCPVCGSSVDHADTVEQLHGALGELRRSLAGVSRDRPKLEEHIRALDSEANEIRIALRETRTRITALVREQENVRRELALGARRERFLGRLSLYLESIPDEAEMGLLLERLEDVAAEVDILESRLARSSIAEQLENMRQRVSFVATQLMLEMPGDALLHSGSLDVDLRKMEANLQTTTRRLSMEEVGSDENYLTIHLAVALAFHRVFMAEGRPVPSVLFLDQISRPYFPSDSDAPIPVGSSNERDKIAQYFDAIAREVDVHGGLQVILLEHAYLSDHEGYASAAKHIWPEGRGLIPEGWPVADEV